MYTRWGRTTCPNVTGTQLVYAGRAAGSHYTHAGGGANYLCLPNDPSYLQYRSRSAEHGYLYGAEYETSGGPLSAFHNHNVPCAMCYVSTRGTVLMIPGKTTCPSLLDTGVQRLPDGCILLFIDTLIFDTPRSV